jgi:simple sugar transport system permease protein
METKNDSLFLPLERPASARWRVPRYFEDRRWTGRSILIWTGLLVLWTLALAALGDVMTAGLFLSPRNLENILNQSLNYLLLLPFLAVLAARGSFDFSVASMAGFAAFLCSLWINTGMSWAAAVPLAAAVSGAAGVISGLLVGGMRLNGILVTLVMAGLLRSVIVAGTQYTGMVMVRGDEDTPLLALWAVLLVLVAAALWMSRGPQDAGGSGLRGLWQRGGIYVFTAVGAAFGGMALMFRLKAFSANLSIGSELDALLAVVAGGLWLGGSRPHVAGALIAGLGFVLFTNLCYLNNIDSASIMAVKALAIIVDLLLLWGYNAIMGLWYRSQKPGDPPTT